MRKYVFALLFLASIPNVVQAAWTQESRSTDDMTVTLSTVVARARQLLDDPNSEYGTVRYSSSSYYVLINIAHKLLAVQTGALTTWATQQITAGTTEYALPADCVYLQRVLVDGNDRNGDCYIPQQTVFRMDAEESSWTVDTSSQVPTSYYLRNRYLGMYPVPKNSGAKLTIWYAKTPAVLDSEDDKVFDGMTVLEPYWELLSVYAAARLALQEGNTTAYTTLMAEWQGGLGSILSVIRYNPNFAPENLQPK
jgi:hypothetical protein